MKYLQDTFKYCALISGLLLLACAPSLAQQGVTAAPGKKPADTCACPPPPTPSNWFEKRVIIGQSLATITNNMPDPAQFQATFPRHDTASYLANIGVSVVVWQGKSDWQLKATGEWHRNTMTDSAQNSAQIGFTLNKIWFTSNVLQHILMADAKYVYDGIAITNSFASDLSYMPYIDGHRFNLNAQTKLSKDWTWTALIAPYVGGQFEQTFAAKNDSAKGGIFRPVFSLSATLSWNHLVPVAQRSQASAHPILTLTTSYTGRWDAINSTEIHEGYTNLFSAALRYYLLTKPVQVSIGPTFQVGSDPMAGLKQQQYWQISINIAKKASS